MLPIQSLFCLQTLPDDRKTYLAVSTFAGLEDLRVRHSFRSVAQSWDVLFIDHV